MARFSLSFFSVFLVLAAFAMSMPTKREQSPGLGLGNLFTPLQDAVKSVESLGNKDANNQKSQAQSAQPPKQVPTPVQQKVDEKQAIAETPAPTPTEKGLYSGNFQTPTTTHTSHATSQPNELGKIPIVGGLLGGTGLGI
ncbi:hypothetical protein PEBR_36534 [Penicillium brasilianum]|nr:hypothetical protein PEBR_36534 [Penicillium brasilianum]